MLQEEEGVDIIKSQDGHTMEVTKKEVGLFIERLIFILI